MADTRPQKQTVQSTGIWETIRRAVSIDPNRSNGVPLNPYFRNPTPGAQDPHGYDDPVTVPAGDIADNAYWKRDSRRSYPQTSKFTQANVSGLLSVGSAAQPKVELIGEAGEKQLVAAREDGEALGLARHFERAPQAAAQDLFVNGLPPTPAGTANASGAWDVHHYELSETAEQAYPEGCVSPPLPFFSVEVLLTCISRYPCRTFK